VSTDAASAPAVELRDVRKNFGRTEIIRGVNLSIPAANGMPSRPERRRQDTLFNLISGRFPITSGSITVNGQSTADLAPQEINRSACRAASRSPRSSRACRVREHPCGCCGPGLSLFVLAAAGNQKELNLAPTIAGTPELADRRISGGSSPTPSSARWKSASPLRRRRDLLLDETDRGMSHSETESAVALIRSVTEGRR